MLVTTLILTSTLVFENKQIETEALKRKDTGGIIIIKPDKKKNLYDTGGIIIIRPKKDKK